MVWSCVDSFLCQHYVSVAVVITRKWKEERKSANVCRLKDVKLMGKTKCGQKRVNVGNEFCRRKLILYKAISR